MEFRSDKLLNQLLVVLMIITMFLVSRQAMANASEVTGAAQSRKATPTLSLDAKGAQRLDGSFFQPDLVVNWDASDFSAEYDVMKDVDMDHVIWQWTVDSKRKQAYYPTEIPGISAISTNDLVETSLKEAKKQGIKVWLGLNSNDDWSKYYANNEKWLTTEVSLSKAIAQELWSRYGAKYGDTIAGFYLPMEVDNVHFQNKEKQKRIAEAYLQITEEIHHMAKKPVMIAPFFNQKKGLDASKYADMWGNILRVAPIDVIALQDGIGCDHASVDTIGKWLSVLEKKMKEVRPATELWSDLETYSSGFVSAPIERVIRQVNAERNYVKKFTSFSFNHYDSPNNGQFEEFYQYKQYVDSLTIPKATRDL